MCRPSTLVAGETLVDFIPDRPGPLPQVESFSPRPGGAPANVAVAMARLDDTPYLLTRLATDDFGDHLARRLDAEAIPDEFVQRDSDRQTTLAFVTHDSDADRSFSFYRENAADAHITASTVPDSVLEAIDRLAIGGYMLTNEPGRTAIFELVDRARAHDCTVVFDPNTRPELWPPHADPVAVLESMLDRADIVKTATDDFADLDYPSAPEQLADRILDRSPHTVLLTMGSAGSALYANDDAPWGAGTWSHDGYRVDTVDTTGAGDAFLGGVLVALDEETDLTEANQTDADQINANRTDVARTDVDPTDANRTDVDPTELLSFANAVAALTTTGDGAWTALPDRDAVEGLRAGHD